MTRIMTLEIPNEIDQGLRDEAQRTGKTREQVALEWIGGHVQRSQRGTVGTLMPFYGVWSMTPEEQTHIEQMIEEERLLEENEGGLNNEFTANNESHPTPIRSLRDR